jgi:hypothetical protein
MPNYESEMEYKRHEHEFFKLRESLADIQKQSVESKKSIGGIKEYYLMVQSLYLINSSYVIDKNNVSLLLNSVEKMLNDKHYRDSILNINKSNELKIRDYELKICHKIDDALRLMAESFVNVELRPRPQVIDRDASKVAGVRS